MHVLFQKVIVHSCKISHELGKSTSLGSCFLGRKAVLAGDPSNLFERKRLSKALLDETLNCNIVHGLPPINCIRNKSDNQELMIQG